MKLPRSPPISLRVTHFEMQRPRQTRTKTLERFQNCHVFSARKTHKNEHDLVDCDCHHPRSITHLLVLHHLTSTTIYCIVDHLFCTVDLYVYDRYTRFHVY